MDNNKKDAIRLQKYLALCGIASRRASEEIILQGRVKVNGTIIDQLGFKVNPNDKVYLDNKLLKPEINKVYIMLNKPENVITSAKDQFNRTTVLDLIKGIPERIYPVGRLDYDTKGLILLTNDGEFMNKITHPSKAIVKTYLAKIDGVPDENQLDMLRKGVVIDSRKTSPAEVRLLNVINDKSSVIEIKIHEGRNRQVRKMFSSIGFNVTELIRTAIGKLNLGGLPAGEWIHLSEYDRKLIFK